MTWAMLIDALSRRAPFVVVVTLLVALVGYWTSAPDWLLTALAIAIGSLALMLWATRCLPLQFKSKEELGFTRTRDWLAYELVGKGAPRGYYILGFLGVITILFTEFQSLAFAGFALGIVWGIVNARYPADRNTSNL